jgi:hypothetical protein
MTRALHWVQDLACWWSADCSSNAEVLPESQVSVFVDWPSEQFPRASAGRSSTVYSAQEYAHENPEFYLSLPIS